MKSLSPILQQTEDGTFVFRCPGCEFPHQVDSRWVYNGDPYKPSFTPSLLVERTYGENNERQACHSFITDGCMAFLGDCTHELAGKTVLIPDWEK